MTDTDLDRLLDELLAETLSIEQRPADLAFASKVELRIAELERYRRWRTKMVHRFMTQLVAVAAIGGALALISQIPDRALTMAAQPVPVWPGLLIMLTCWLALTGMRPRLVN